ncbi:hypothetical protein PRIPAC_75566, partial [Pristionchus pacificus]|uniref:Uncharacterized protein n=1 Tax=Pristionchus pacificus TaxID=54126 RepID=A0A2A6C5T5_PRIPA
MDDEHFEAEVEPCEEGIFLTENDFHDYLTPTKLKKFFTDVHNPPCSDCLRARVRLTICGPQLDRLLDVTSPHGRTMRGFWLLCSKCGNPRERAEKGNELKGAKIFSRTQLSLNIIDDYFTIIERTHAGDFILKSEL